MKRLLINICCFMLFQVVNLYSIVIHQDINGYQADNADEPLAIESYVEGNNEVVHPDVVFFEEGWQGYQYWMAYTPFPDSNAQFENPSIAVSQDGLNWLTPEGLVNPIMTPFNDSYNPNNYYHSDPDIIMSEDNQTMYVFWREHTGWRYETIRYVYSTDGINWSDNQFLLETDGYSTERVISPALVRDDNEYKMWTVNTKTSPRTINLRTSDNLTSGWSDPIATDLGVIAGSFEIWHLDVTYIDGKYYMLSSVGPSGAPRGGDLYLAVSDNGINWTMADSPILQGVQNAWDNNIYRSTILPYKINNHLNFKVWYSSDGGTATDNNLWEIGYTEFLHENTPTNELPNDLYISEVMYNNNSWTHSNYLDSFGQQSDWIELYNAGTESLDLSNYFLSDDRDDLTKWTFPDTIIPAGQRIVVWCNQQYPLPGLNTNFKLNNDGESVYLTFVDYETIIDSVKAIDIPADYSFGRASFNSEFHNVFSIPTPGSLNQVQSSGIDVQITEVMAKNQNFITDNDGNYSDWIELHNNSLFPINLNYFTLSDDIAEANKWQFSNITLLPNEYHVVWASGKDKKNHTNFSISASGEDLILTGLDGENYSNITTSILGDNQSFSLLNDTWQISNTPTPYTDNLNGATIEDIFINEVKNNGELEDFDYTGISSDWIEIYNASNQTVNLGGMYLSDNWQNYTKWQIPNTLLPANSVALFWCSGADTTYANNEIHTNFSISSEGEEVILVASDGQTVINTFYAEATDIDYSLGRYPNGSDLIYEYLAPSPGLLNPMYQLPDYSLYINEVMSSNDNYFDDYEGDDGDWFELINYGQDAIDLDGLYLSDDINNLGKWLIEDKIINPNEILLFWADNKDRQDEHGYMHTNFKLSSSETLYLSHFDSISVIDSVPCSVSGNNYSIARRWDNISQWEEVAYPSPGNNNELSYNFSEAIYLNEVCSDNETLLADAEGDYSDWIELWNQKDYPINLNQFMLTDDETDLNKWKFPELILDPNSYYLLWCSNKDSLIVDEIHTNFSISRSGEKIIFSDLASNEIDHVRGVYIPEDASYGRIFENPHYHSIFLSPTPNAENFTTAQPILEPCTVSLDAGFYEDTQVVTLSHSNTAGSIYYTLDGSEPTAQSNLYTGPLTISSRMNEANGISTIRTTIPEGTEDYLSETDFWTEPQSIVDKATVLKCRVIQNGYVPSSIDTRSYFIGTGISSRFDLSVFSITTDQDNLFSDETGIYVPGAGFQADNTDWHNANYNQSGLEWERPAYVEYFDTGLELSMARECGIRIHGGASTRRNRKSLRLYARDEYGGDMFEYQLFPDYNQDKFHKFILRNSGQDSNKTNFRDAFIHNLAGGLNIERMQYKPVVVFINGEYWGLHNIRNRLDEDYIEETYGIPEDQVDIIAYQNQFIAENGTNEAFMDLRNLLENNDMSEPTAFAQLSSMIDINNFIDYYATEIYAANYDWPYNNLRMWRKHLDVNQPDARRGHDGRWRWLLYDLDSGLGEYSGSATDNTLEDATTWHDNWQDMFRLLTRSLLGDYPYDPANSSPKIGSEEVRNKFINRMADLLNSNFREERTSPLIEEMKERISHEMTYHTQRWSSPDNLVEWDAKIQSLRNFVNDRNPNIRQHFIEKFPFIDGTSNVSLNVNDESMGIIQISTIRVNESLPGVDTSNIYPWSGLYFNGLPIVIKAIPNRGYSFQGWSGDSNEATNSITVTLSGDITLTANFVSDTAPQASIIINEFMSANSTLTGQGFIDYYGNDSDWIEIYNNGQIAVQLNDYYLSDDSLNPSKWQFPEYILQPQEFIQIWASDNNITAPNGEIHTNFKISSSGEPLIITSVIGAVTMDFIDAVTLQTDTSYGRTLDGGDTWQVFASPTPGFSNSQLEVPNVSITENTTANELLLQWTAIENAIGYKIYSSDIIDFDIEGMDFIYTSETSYSIQNPDLETKMFFKVVATTDSQVRNQRVIRSNTSNVRSSKRNY